MTNSTFAVGGAIEVRRPRVRGHANHLAEADSGLLLAGAPNRRAG